jgi:DNA-binding transcriptional MerR regulator
MEDLIPIGQFARASRLSQKALRLYGENGLLPPAWVDPDTGYRYYRLEQLRTATLIGLLRRAGMPLNAIRSFLRAPAPERLEEFERQITADFAEQRRVLRYIQRILKEEPMFDVQTKQVPVQRYVSRSTEVYVKDLEPFITDTLKQLFEEYEPAGHPFSLFHGPVNHEENGPVEVGLPTSDGDKELAAGEVAFTIATGHQCDFPEILGAYDAVARWASEQGRELDGAPREIYLWDPAKGETPEMEIAWLLK